MKLNVITWNTFCSPSMYGRIKRKKNVCKLIKEFSKIAEIVILQEITSFRIGKFHSSIYTKFKQLYNYSPLLLVLDYLSIIEGKYFPGKVWNNHKDIINIGKKCGYKYSIASPLPKNYLNSGLVILSKYPLRGIKYVKMEGDTIHIPGAIITKVNLGQDKEYEIGNVYFVPSLRNFKFSYIICNIMNFFSEKKPIELRKQAVNALKEQVIGGKVIIGGDFNIKKNTIEYLEMLKTLNLKDSTKRNRIKNSNFLFIERQIDYILTSIYSEMIY